MTTIDLLNYKILISPNSMHVKFFIKNFRKNCYFELSNNKLISWSIKSLESHGLFYSSVFYMRKQIGVKKHLEKTL